MHRDIIDELAQEFQGELLVGGVEVHTISRMIERAVKKAVENGSHMAVADVWRLAGGSPELDPDVETVVAAIEALKPADGRAIQAPNVTAIEQAVLRVSSSNFSDHQQSSDECRARVARYIANEFAPQDTSPASTGADKRHENLVPDLDSDEYANMPAAIPGVEVKLDENRSVWAGKRDDRTFVHLINSEKKSTRFTLSPDATKALLAVLVEVEFPRLDEELDGLVGGSIDAGDDPIVARAYQRDWEKSVRAIKFWSKDLPEIDGLSPENAIYTLAGMLLTVRDSMRDQTPLGWLHRDASSHEWTFSATLPKGAGLLTYRPVHGMPIDVEHVAINAQRYLIVRELLGGRKPNPELEAQFTALVENMPDTLETFDFAMDAIASQQTAAKADWIRRFAAHCVGKGMDGEQAQILAETTYDPVVWVNVTPEAAAEQDLERASSAGTV